MSVTRLETTCLLLRSVMHHAIRCNWAPLAETPLPNGRRADVLALRGDGAFVIFEVKSCAADFTADLKWPDYREFCDRLFFAVDCDFPRDLLPEDAGLLVCDGHEAAVVREAPEHPLAPARRRALLQRFARQAALRAAALADPEGMAALRAALRSE